MTRSCQSHVWIMDKHVVYGLRNVPNLQHADRDIADCYTICGSLIHGAQTPHNQQTRRIEVMYC